ncbi:hypothetical protein DPF_0852 [Desulfoplanes formicivorans]|uniref:Uncharacterized protein n=2 Tax=Desulfoplanes formicivorans TaxID=1592317 RepID=A0A194AHB4_9BACT|nr:hypothetical protein DPF_0852 [Desulfoplanes formicivorans]
MDDTVIVSNDKAGLRQTLERIKEYLAADLSLRLNPKTRIYPASQGVDFCGYRIWKTHILPRKRTVKKTRRRMKGFVHRYANGTISAETIRQSLSSWLGYMKHCNGYRTTIGELKRISQECRRCGVNFGELFWWLRDKTG